MGDYATELRANVGESAALRALSEMHADVYTAATDGALDGKRMVGKGYDGAVYAEVWMDFNAAGDVVGYHVMRGNHRQYKTARGWARAVSRACHGVRAWEEKVR